MYCPMRVRELIRRGLTCRNQIGWVLWRGKRLGKQRIRNHAISKQETVKCFGTREEFNAQPLRLYYEELLDN